MAIEIASGKDMEGRAWRDPDEQELTDALKKLVAKRNHLRDAELVTEERLFNVIQFAILFNIDLRCLQQDVVAAGDTWRAKLYARYLVLVLYEAADDFSALLGTHVRAVLREWDAPAEMTATLNVLHGRISTFRRENETLFGRVRNSLAGHRDHDANLQMDILSAINIEAVITQSLTMLALMTDLHRFITLILDWKPTRAHSAPARRTQ